jgi:dienelactone hydrolase
MHHTEPCALNPAHNQRDDPLSDFAARDIELLQTRKRVYTAGHGPAVVIMAELPGISPHVARFARWVRDAGFTVYLPSLFGRDGAYPEADAGLNVARQVCISAEFRAFSANESSPITHWLRALARLAHEECGGPGVGAVGMCFTGNFGLLMMLEPAVLAPVMCQPALPLDNPAGLAASPAELALVRQRLEAEDLTVMAVRFSGDRHCHAARFNAYRDALGPRFVAREVDDSAAHPNPPPFFAQVVGCPHSVMTAHLIDEAGQATRAARDEMLAFLKLRLQA